MARIVVVAAVGVAVAACGGEAPIYEVTSGLYQVSTAEIGGDCKLDYALRPGALAVGNVMPSAVTSSPVSVEVHVCRHPDEDPSCGGLDYGFSMARDGNGMAGSMPWLAPGCGDPNYQPSLTVVGTVTDTDRIDLTWTATITSSDPAWECSGYRPCRSTIEQRMAMGTPGS